VSSVCVCVCVHAKLFSTAKVVTKLKSKGRARTQIAKQRKLRDSTAKVSEFKCWTSAPQATEIVPESDLNQAL
jgi:hypothetical protein